MTAPEDFEDALRATAGLVEGELDRLLADAPLPGETFRPLRLLAAMRHAALGGGKRLRPFLVIETARLFGVSPEDALPAATALELLHVYSLVHDDLPAMDDDDLRRGKPTVHRAFDEATAILAGDALLTLAFDTLADPRCHADPTIRSALVLALARGAGLGGMAGGQMLDLAAEGRFEPGSNRPPLEPADIRRLQAMKTGALIATAVAFGAILGSASPTERAALDVYARAFGTAFQIADDILDIEGDAATLGKTTGKDEGKGKATLPHLLGLTAARAERDRLAGEAAAALEPFGLSADNLRGAARFAATRRS